MKIYVLYARENWITDVLAEEWIRNNRDLYTSDIDKADTIWILSDYIIHKIPYYYLQNKRVVTTIHHIVPEKVTSRVRKHFYQLNTITNVFHSLCPSTTTEMQKYFNKPILTLPFWNNEKDWFSIDEKENLRRNFGLGEDDFLVGSFQKDTETASIWNGTILPKLEKGPDLFVKAVEVLKKNRYPKLKVVLSGYYRHYIKRELERRNIEYYYFEKASMSDLNKLYNTLDLYVVASRVEGGPRAINECALTCTPLLTTDVGVAPYIVSPDSIFDGKNINSILQARTDVKYNYNRAEKYMISKYMRNFTREILL